MEVVSFAVGDTLFPDGGQTGCLYILISGAVDVSKGDSLLAKIREPGAILGEIAVLLDQPHSARVEATEPTTCYVSHAGNCIPSRYQSPIRRSKRSPRYG